MTEDSRRPSHPGGFHDTAQPDASLEDLRQILFGQQVARLEGDLDDLERRLTDRETLIAIIAPVLGDAIRYQVRNARDEMIEALYPILGQLVVRAVSEAIRDLARNIDAQMRTSFSPAAMWRRLQARVSGVSGTEVVLRESLPYEVTEIFLIHRETGLLLRRVSHNPKDAPDSDLISGMLTAVHDFAQEAFGRGREGQLEEIQYGEWRILIEAARYVYLAVVIDGIEPAGFRSEMREQIIAIDHAHARTLRDYDGDSASIVPVDAALSTLMPVTPPNGVSPAQKRVLVGAAGLLAVCLIGACVVGVWTWRLGRGAPVALPVAVGPTPTLTATLSPTSTAAATQSPTSTASATPSPTATWTPTPTPTPAPTATSTPSTTPSPAPAPAVGLMTGNAWLRAGPSGDSNRLGMTLERGQLVEILAVFGDWYRVRWVVQDEAEVVGWVPARWVGTTAPIPTWMITPTPES
jgi:hypothetical protein